MKTFRGQLKQAGISLLEVLLSLAIIAIILVMAMQYFTTASVNQKLNMVRTVIGVDMAAVQSYGINNPAFAAIDWDTLVTNGYVSRDPKNITCTTINTDGSAVDCSQVTPWGDKISIQPAGSGYATITIPLPSTNLCNNLADSYGSTVVDCTTAKKATIYLNGTSSGA